ncbi:2'-5' RNA ligase family protein [Pseudactinotalea suaedae]|jgi:2'-5' RNA ligase|uniref:2'-5' RNA ligase family protein n=1 Tax=Pseudactinotalea suaedae TaxID=1524924 RepID=UPI0012E20616|nr:2'-5' RNA ligase family protein [Pseudactinotalea suaedae]
MRVPPRVGSQISIGVAIPIPAPYSESLTRARIDAGDPEALAIAPHITLMPPSVIEPEQMGEVRAHLRQVATQHAPFVVGLAGTDTFRPISPVVFVAVTEGAEGCAELHGSVVGGPLAQEMRFPYHPHVTIAHDLDDVHLDDAGRSRADFEARFPVAQFALYEYGDDGVWREVEIFSLVAHDVGGQR